MISHAECPPPTEETIPAPSSLAMGQMGMWLFLGTEVMFFTALLATYLILRFSVAGPDGSGWPNPSQTHMNAWIGLGNTGLLLLSSVMVSLAVRALGQGSDGSATKALWLAIALGAGFLGVKAYEYHGKYEHRLLPGRIGEVFPEGSTISRRYDEGPGLPWLESIKPGLEATVGSEYRLILGKEKAAVPANPAQMLDSVRRNPGKSMAYDLLLALDKSEATPSMAARSVFQTSESIRFANQHADKEDRHQEDDLKTPPALPHGNLCASCYFALTGLHGVHLVIGLVVLGIPATLGVVGRLRPDSLPYLTNAALYWHFVDLVWIIIFPLLYLL